jgi:hypothetical protein
VGGGDIRADVALVGRGDPSTIGVALFDHGCEEGRLIPANKVNTWENRPRSIHQKVFLSQTARSTE